MFSAAHSTPQLAMAAGAAWATAIGVVVIAVLIGAFWWGSRRAAHRPVPPQEPQPRSESWHEPEESTMRHSRAPDPDDPGR